MTNQPTTPRVVALILVFVTIPFFARPADAQGAYQPGYITTEVCNRGNVDLFVSTAVAQGNSSGTNRPYDVKGWTKLVPGACGLVYSNTPTIFDLALGYVGANGVFGTGNMGVELTYQSQGSLVSARLSSSAWQAGSRQFCVDPARPFQWRTYRDQACGDGLASMFFGLTLSPAYGSTGSIRVTLSPDKNATVTALTPSPGQRPDAPASGNDSDVAALAGVAGSIAIGAAIVDVLSEPRTPSQNAQSSAWWQSILGRWVAIVRVYDMEQVIGLVLISPDRGATLGITSARGTRGGDLPVRISHSRSDGKTEHVDFPSRITIGHFTGELSEDGQTISGRLVIAGWPPSVFVQFKRP